MFLITTGLIMNDVRLEWISKRAYSLWEQEGRPWGRDQHHWDQATRERDEFERVALPGAKKGKASKEADTLTKVAVAATRKPKVTAAVKPDKLKAATAH